MRYQTPLLRYTALLVALAVLGCGNPNSQGAKSTTQSPAPKGNEPPRLKVANDASLTSEEYIRQGLPAHDREWSGNDMVKAAKVLTALAKADYLQLPRYKSKRSGEMFARLTSPQNLNLYRNRSIPVEARLGLALIHYQAANAILKLYYSAALKRKANDDDLVELMGTLLRTTVVMIELQEEFVPTIKKDDPTYEVRMQGVQQMKQGLATIVSGGLVTLTERGFFRDSELIRLAGYMKETFPRILPKLPAGSRIEMMTRLEKMKEDPTLKELQPSLRELHSRVKAALDKSR